MRKVINANYLNDDSQDALRKCIEELLVHVFKIPDSVTKIHGLLLVSSDWSVGEQAQFQFL